MNTINLIPRNSINPFDLFRKSPIQLLHKQEEKLLTKIEEAAYKTFCLGLELETTRNKIAFFRSKG